MQPYEDPDSHFERYMERAADRYVDGLNRTGLQSNDRLTQAMAERIARDARDDYEVQTYDTFQGNMNTVLSDYHQRDRQIRQEGARMAWKTCPLIALVFGALSWLNFKQGHADMGLLFAFGALAFLVMLVLAHRQQGGRHG